MFEPQYSIAEGPKFKATAFASRHNEELAIRVADIEPEFTLILKVLRDAGSWGDGLIVKLTVVRGAGDIAKIAVSLRLQRRTDAFTIFLNQRHQLAWLGNTKFWGAEPSSVTSRDFLADLEKRIDAFVIGANSVDRFNGVSKQ